MDREHGRGVDLRIDCTSARYTPVEFRFDGELVLAREGETVAMALWASGVRQLRSSPVRAEPRGVFCGMGVCQECVVLIDGRRREACTTVVRQGLVVVSNANELR
jgi:predicted molibdopterin-dependent oxidoreductase YjgC